MTTAEGSVSEMPLGLVPVYLDGARPVEERVDDLVSRMTLDEKVSQMVYDARGVERLEIPEYNWWNECLHGVGRAGMATVFPQAIGLAATWDEDLIGEVAETISDEARAKHHEALRKDVRQIYSGLTFWSPNVNIFRDPRWGRGQETYGEDPYLSARMGVRFIRGLQGEDPQYLKLVATAKHYAVHSGPEGLRHHFDARVGNRDLWDTYLPAFEACVIEGKAQSVMGAYNRVNSEAACASPTLLGKILRERWGFDGYVVSDCWAIKDIYLHHKVVETEAQAAALAVNEGCELNCGDTYPALIEAVEQGLISEETITCAVKRLFLARFKLGMFDPPDKVPYAQIPYEVNDSAAHRALALKAAQESIVLLKNAGQTLPLSKDLKSIAVIGPTADDPYVLVGNYNGTPSKAVTPLEGIRRKVSDSTIVYSARGCDIAPGSPTLSVVPAQYLRPDSADAGQTGLTGTYYDNPNWTGAPQSVQIDPEVNFIWKSRFAETFSIRWTGFLVPPVSGTYTLGANGMSGYTLCLDGEKLAEYRGVHHPIRNTEQVELEAGRLYRVQLNYQNAGFDPRIQLLWSVPGTDYLTQALEVANKADVVVITLGLSPLLEGEEMPIEIDGFDRGDRIDIGLPAPQESLLKQVIELGKPVVVVLMNGSALAVNYAEEHATAIVEAWYPGEEGGTALADVLFGDHNPAGRLPVTFYKSVEDLPPFEDYSMTRRTYRYFRGEALYKFGYGLNYTTFTYSNLQCSSTTLVPGQDLMVTVDVENVGDRSGDEVVQVYLTDVAASVPVPVRKLVGFKRINLAAGAKEAVTFSVAARQMALVNDDGQRVIEPGAFQLGIGGRQPCVTDFVGECTEVVTGSFEIVGRATPID
ncbi:MAG: glycoside hydrolase family 3 C-terminal domain-containing protein [Anaerolineae bacterium]|nr:glycoside hydrolase family 3 C-terminal domain-containing protein [Anaerolineae bacterium]